MSSYNGLHIKTSKIVLATGINRRQGDELAQRAIENILIITHEHIHRLASGLKTGRKQYIQGLQRPQIKRLRGTIELVGVFPNMLEQGATAFDIKEGFSKSEKRKFKEDGGWYMHIPFRIATPEAIANSGEFSGRMPTGIYDMVRRMESHQTMFGMGKVNSGQGMTYGMLESSGVGGATERKTREEITRNAGGLSDAKRQAYQHRTPLMQGLFRSAKTYERATQGTYHTFRTVSDRSPQNAWIHKGLVARRFFDRALEQSNIEIIVDNTVGEFLTELGL